MAKSPPISQAEIRRFDIFAEWNRLKAQHAQHLSETDAQAYGLAVAKVVAGRKSGHAHASQASEWRQRAKREDMSDAWWKHLGSSHEFTTKIVERMGETFYRRVFQPAVRRAWREGKKYEEIRDTLRGEWNRHHEEA
jgi:hypothetical protein